MFENGENPMSETRESPLLDPNIGQYAQAEEDDDSKSLASSVRTNRLPSITSGQEIEPFPRYEGWLTSKRLNTAIIVDYIFCSAASSLSSYGEHADLTTSHKSIGWRGLGTPPTKCFSTGCAHRASTHKHSRTKETRALRSTTLSTG